MSAHVVLGGNGVAGREALRALQQRGVRTVSVGRRPNPSAGTRSVVADLLDPEAVHRVLRGAEVAYLTAGLPYSARVWQRRWPAIVQHAIDAALAHGTHLVVLDNVYAYGPVDGPMTERTPLRPTGRKGRVRADALRALASAAERGLAVTVARSADFYGPGAATSSLQSFVLDRVAAGRRPAWLLDADQPHSFTYAPDVGAALATIGTDPAARGRVWHVPTAPAATVREIATIASGGRADVAVMSAATLRLGAVFSRDARETLELTQQYTAPYVFDSSAFESAFGVAPTPLEVGVAAALRPAVER